MKKLLIQFAFVCAAVTGFFAPVTAQAQWWGYNYNYNYNYYPYSGYGFPVVPRMYVPPPVIYVQPPPPVIYVQPPPPPPTVIEVRPDYNAPPGYRWRNVWDNACQCNRAVLIPQ